MATLGFVDRADAQENIPGSTGTPNCDVAHVIEFRGSRAALSKPAKATLDEVALATKDSPTRSVRLRGAAAPSDPAAGPKARARAKLSERRTEAVKGYLSEKGVSATQITVAGATEMQPLASMRTVEVVTCVTPAPVAAAPPAPAAEETAPLAAAPPPSVITVPSPSTPEPALPQATPPMAMSTPPPPAPSEQYNPPSMRGLGIGAMVGGGVTGFVDEQARAFTSPGGGWEARMMFGTRSPLAIEAAYVGSAQNIDALGLGGDALLLANGAEANARLNFTRRFVVQPYLFGGVGWEHYSLANEGTNTSSLRATDDVLTVPFGVGIAFRLTDQLQLDLRGTARAAFDDQLMEGPYANTGQDARLHTWNAAARVGWEF